MSWWGQRHVAEDPAEHAKQLERLLLRIGASGDPRSTYAALHELVARTPVDDERVVERLVDLLAHPAVPLAIRLLEHFEQVSLPFTLF